MVQKYEVSGDDPVTVYQTYGEKPQQYLNELLSPDQYSLQEIYIISALDRISISSLVSEVSYYEDMLTGASSGSVLIVDSINLIDRLGLSGFDYLKLKFSKTDKSSKAATVEKYFRIYKVGERLMNNNATETYTLHFCTEEFFLSEQTKISKSYPGKKISEVVYDILSNKLKIDNKFIRIQETEGLYDFVIPYKKPYEAINWLATYARPIGKVGSDFLFFENSEGFNFYSLQNLFSQSIYSTYYYMPRSLGELKNKTSETGRNLVSIKSYVFLDTFDSLYGTVSGAFANRLITLDPLTRTYRDTKFNLNEYFEKSVTLNKYSIAPTLKNRLGKTATESYDTVLKVITSNADQKKALGISDKPWSVGNDIYAETYIPNRTAQMALSHYSRIKIAVSGDPNLSIGMIISIVLPSNRSKDGTGYESGENDLFNTGNYIITAVRHIIDTKNKYETVIEVAKDSYGNSVDNYINSQELQKAIEGKL